MTQQLNKTKHNQLLMTKTFKPKGKLSDLVGMLKLTDEEVRERERDLKKFWSTWKIKSA